MKAMTQGERDRILELYQMGWSTDRIAQAIKRSPAGVRRIRQRYHERGHNQALARGNGRPSSLSQQDLQLLQELLEQHPDATIDEYRSMLGDIVSRSTVDRAIRHLKFTFKKRPSTQQSKIAPTSSSNA